MATGTVNYPPVFGELATVEKLQQGYSLARLGDALVTAAIPDASDWSLPRAKDTNSARRRQKEANGDTAPKNPLRFPWQREL